MVLARRKTDSLSRARVAGRVFFALLAVQAAGAQAPPQSSLQPFATPAPAVIEFTDETGRRVSVPQPVRRIVSLAPSLTETVYALGAQERLVGDTDYCDYPPEAQAKPKVGGAVNPNIEHVVALRPDLVLATKSLNRRETVVALERLGIAAYATDPHSVEDVLASTARLGEVISARDTAQTLVAGLRLRLNDLKLRLGALPPRRVLFVVWTEPLISVGRDTFIADALRWAGAESVVQVARNWPQLSLEEAVRLQPEYLVFAASHAEIVARDLDALAALPGWRDLDAVRNRRFAVISDAVNRPAPRLISAIEQLARQLHPEAFAEKNSSPQPLTDSRPPRAARRRAAPECNPCAP